jgi:hypothetical protein
MDKETGGVKLLLTYNVKQEEVQEYYQFVLGRYIPAVQALGLEMSEAWHTAYGESPNRLVGFVARDKETMNNLLADESWGALNEQLQRFVTHFHYKVIPYREGFQF